MACALKIRAPREVTGRLSAKFGKLWLAAEVVLFVLVGAAVLLTLWGWPVSAALGADVVLLALLDAALWMVLSRRASITYCLREYSK